eukprot:TRINITY_DN9705_c1_g1_i9.p1 TRINITY_DN9705_c1_g1~~TRINITY_DN9705_c1_g1_i9.p1  ORF type:complete len:582 (-),score=148.17 TRINITY_DN9705_c1_g1_i9:491-2236(-)
MSQSQSNSAFISVRIVTMDHYQGEPMECLDPFQSDRGYEIKRVPVIRVFGPTPAGQNVCLHIHGIFPYLYIPAPQKEDDGFLYRLCSSIDSAINTSYNQSKSTVQHVYKAVKVSGRPFYGYHPRQHNFIKLYFYNYFILKRASEMLANGQILKEVLQPHESHVPFELQFMMDYNLQGMNLIHLKHAVFRQGTLEDEYDEIEPFDDLKPPNAAANKAKESQEGAERSRTPSQSYLFGTPGLDRSRVDDQPATQRYFHLDDLPDFLKLPTDTKRISTSELEIDAVAADILNCNDLAGDGAMNPGLKALWEDERERRRILGMDDPLTPPSSPPRAEAAHQSSESEKFWMERFETMLKEKKERDGVLSLSPSSDPDATINFQQSIGSSTYAGETSDQELAVLPAATQLDSHVTTLSASILEASQLESGSSPSSQSQSLNSTLTQSQIGTPKRIVYYVQQSDEDYNNSQLEETQVIMDDSDEELVDVLADLVQDESDEELVDILADLVDEDTNEKTHDEGQQSDGDLARESGANSQTPSQQLSQQHSSSPHQLSQHPSSSPHQLSQHLSSSQSSPPSKIISSFPEI